MNIKVYASSVLGVWAALRMRLMGHPTELFLLKTNVESLRPVRLSRAVLSPIITKLSELGIPVSFILEAPALKGWVSPTGESFEKLFSQTGHQEERWIDTQKLKETLLRACELEGVAVFEVEVFPEAAWGNLDFMGIYEAAPQNIAHWPRAFQSPANTLEYDMTEILFPRGMESALQKLLFFEFEGVKGILENLNRQKSVLTLISRSRILIDRLLEDLRTNLSENQAGNLRALFALNPHVFRKDYKYQVGESSLYIPNFCLLGMGMGSYSPLMNTHVREGFKQVLRLEENIQKSLKVHSELNPTRVAEDWYYSERKAYFRLSSWQKTWEESLWSRMGQSWTLRVQQYLPNKIRDILCSPF